MRPHHARHSATARPLSFSAGILTIGENHKTNGSILAYRFGAENDALSPGSRCSNSKENTGKNLPSRDADGKQRANTELDSALP